MNRKTIVVKPNTISYLEIFKYVLSVRPFLSEPAREIVSHPPWWTPNAPVAVRRVL
jgi:hypothetical protein